MKYVLLFTELILFILGIVRMKKDKEIFNPFLLFSSPLLVSLVINLLYYDKRYIIKGRTYFIYLLSVISVALGLVLGTKVKLTFKLKSIKSVTKCSYGVIWAFTLFSSFFAISQILEGFRSGIYGTSLNNLINNVRYYSQYVEEGNFFSIYGMVTADVLMLLLMYRCYVLKDNTQRKKMVVALLLYAVFVATVFNRTAILYCTSAFAFFYAQKNRNFSKKQKQILLLIILFFILVIFLFNYIAVNTDKGTMGVFGDHWLIYYFGAEFYWLQRFALNVGFHTYGVGSLGIIGRGLAKVGMLPTENIVKIRALLKTVGNPVSSFVSAPYLDFGYGGLLVLFLYGALYGFIYKNHRRYGDIWTLFYATCVYPLIIAFYSLQFGLSSQIYVFIILIIIGRRNQYGYDRRHGV